MLKREEIITELWSRLDEVPGVAYTARNPKKPPSVDDLPAIQFFEFPDKVLENGGRGYPIYKREMDVIVESFVNGSTENAASKEEMAFLLEMKKKIYKDGNSLGGLCSLFEAEASRVLRPATGGNVAGIGITFKIQYVEDIRAIVS